MADQKDQASSQSKAASGGSIDLGPAAPMPPGSTQSVAVAWTSRPDAWQWARLAALQDGTRPPKDDDQAEKVTLITRSQAILKDKQAASAKAAQAWATARDEEGAAQADLLQALSGTLDGETEDQPVQEQAEAQEAEEDEADGKQP